MPKFVKNPIKLPIVGDTVGNDIEQGYLGIKASDKGLKMVDENGKQTILFSVTDIINEEDLDISTLESGNFYLII